MPINKVIEYVDPFWTYYTYKKYIQQKLKEPEESQS